MVKSHRFFVFSLIFKGFYKTESQKPLVSKGFLKVDFQDFARFWRDRSQDKHCFTMVLRGFTPKPESQKCNFAVFYNGFRRIQSKSLRKPDFSQTLARLLLCFPDFPDFWQVLLFALWLCSLMFSKLKSGKV